MLPEVPPAGGDARPGRPAQGHLRHRHPRRRHQRADPHRAVHRRCRKYDGDADPAAARPASSTRSPAGPAGPASTPSARSSCRRPSTSSRTRRRWPRPATTRRSGARWSARSRRRASSAGASRPSSGSSTAEPEPLTSSFQVSHSMLLNVIDRPGDALRRDAAPAHRQPRGPPPRSAGTSAGPSRSTGRCCAGGVVERLDEPDETGRTVRLTVDLQPDFALNQPLSPFALAALELLDRESPTLRRSTWSR